MRTHGAIEVFHFNFADFADFEHFNWSALHEGAVCSWSLYGMNYRPGRALECRRNGFRLKWELMEIFRFSIPILLILLTLLILRISPGQCSKKERSDHKVCMGCILETIVGLNSVETYSDSHKSSWRYWGFSLQFYDFADFEDVNWPALQEGVVCSWSLYGMHYRLDRALEFRRNGVRIPSELMELLRFFFSIFLILLILRISTGRCFMKERSAHEVCMGWIIDQIGRLNVVETDSNLHENSWSYWGFPF